MSENKNSNDDKRKEDEQDPFDFFKLSTEPKDNGDDDKKQKKLKGLWIFLLIVGILVVLINISGVMRPNDTIPFSKFQENVRNGVYEKVDLSESYFIGYPIGTYTSEKTDNPNPLAMLRGGSSGNEKPDRTFGILSQNFLLVLDEQTKAQPGFEYKMVPTQHNFLLEFIMSWVLPFGLIFLMWRLMFKKIGGGMGGMGSIFGAGQSRHNAVDEGQVKTRFTDVAGVDEAKEELMEVVDFLKAPKKYTDIGGKIPKGVLLVGPPGTGKTLLARAVAGEAGVPFFRISGSDFVEMFVGVGASRVRDLFEQGRRMAPAIIFIDEIDAVGRSRGAGLGGGHDEREQTLNQMLVEMDGFENKDGIIVLAATNRPDVLDPALLRPGRFDRQVTVALPDIKEREAILKVHSAKVPLDKEVNFTRIARATPGMSGAELSNLVNEAALFAAGKNQEKVSEEDFELARDKLLMGVARQSMVISEKEKRMTAYHEAGHALPYYYLENASPLHKVSVIPRGRALGVTVGIPEEDSYSHTRTWLEDQLVILFGGYSAEQLVYQDTTTGTQNDLHRATELARRMVCQWGMAQDVGAVAYNQEDEPVFMGRDLARHKTYSEETARKIDAAVEEILRQARQRCANILSDHRDQLDKLAQALIEKETLCDEEIRQLLGFNPRISGAESTDVPTI